MEAHWGLEAKGLIQVGYGLLAETSLKGAVLLGAALLAAVLMTGASASRRHLVWAIAMGALVLLPVLSLGVPKWHLPISAPAGRVVAAQPSPVAIYSPSVMVLAPGSGPTAAPAEAPSPVPRLNWASVAIMIWAVVALVLLALVLISIARAIWMIRRARPVHAGECVDVLARTSAEIGVGRVPRLVEGDERTMPSTWGVLRPVIAIPRGGLEWRSGRLQAVLAHELAHVRRRDVFTQLVAQVACALNWYNPLAWVALRRLRLASEQACDDIVLTTGIRPSAYAECLIELARSVRFDGRFGGATTAMAEPSQLPARIHALLDERDRSGVPLRILLGSLAAGMVASVVIAGIAPASSQHPDLSLSDHLVSEMSWIPGSEGGVSGDGSGAGRATPVGELAYGDTTPPVLLNSTEIHTSLERNYPVHLKEAGASGTAMLELHVDPVGRVTEVILLHATHPELGEVAVRSLRAARFLPARADGEAVATRIQWPVAFNALGAFPLQPWWALQWPAPVAPPAPAVPGSDTLPGLDTFWSTPQRMPRPIPPATPDAPAQAPWWNAPAAPDAPRQAPWWNAPAVPEPPAQAPWWNAPAVPGTLPQAPPSPPQNGPWTPHPAPGASPWPPADAEKSLQGVINDAQAIRELQQAVARTQLHVVAQEQTLARTSAATAAATDSVLARTRALMLKSQAQIVRAAEEVRRQAESLPRGVPDGDSP